MRFLTVPLNRFPVGAHTIRYTLLEGNHKVTCSFIIRVDGKSILAGAKFVCETVFNLHNIRGQGIEGRDSEMCILEC